jgi:hypothetical protein
MFIFLGKAYRSRDGVKTLAGDSTQALKMAAELNRGFQFTLISRRHSGSSSGSCARSARFWRGDKNPGTGKSL